MKAKKNHKKWLYSVTHAYTLDNECRMANEMTEIIDICNDSGNRHVIWFARLLENHFEVIIAHATYRISSGKVEGTNNLIKTVRRKAYGYRDNDYFFIKGRGHIPQTL